MTVRQVFYRATVEGIIEKTERGYAKVQNDLTILRKSGALPYHYLADSTRWMRCVSAYQGVESALKATAGMYRKDLWFGRGKHIEVWMEKDALAGVVTPVTEEYQVPLMVSRGYASLSFLHSSAENIKAIGCPAYIYHFGDRDPSGVDAARNIEEQLIEMSWPVPVHFERCAVLEEQIQLWDLPSRPTKQSDSRAKNFSGVSVELDAIPPAQLRQMVRGVIERHIDRAELDVLKAAENSERDLIRQLAEVVQADG